MDAMTPEQTKTRQEMSKEKTELGKATKKQKMVFEIWAFNYEWQYDEGTKLWWRDGYNDKTSAQLYSLYLKSKTS